MAAVPIPHHVAISQVKLLNGTALSEVLPLPGYRLIALILPSPMDGTKLRFQASVDNATFHPVKAPDGTAIEVSFAAGDYVQLSDDLFPGCFYLKLQTVDNTGTAVNQTGERVITYVFRD